MKDNLDFDASGLIYDQIPIEEMAKELLNLMVDVANGCKTKAEALGFMETAIARVCNYV